jgi:hypothetical protein
MATEIAGEIEWDALPLEPGTRKPLAMEKPLGHEAIASIVLLEAHRFVDRAADEVMAMLARPPSPRPQGPSPLSEDVRSAIAAAADEMKRGTTLAYPPSDEARLTDEEIAARKIVRAAASSPAPVCPAGADMVASCM